MKRFLFFAVVAMLFAACSKDAISEEQGIQNIVDEVPETLTVGFEDDETRIQLNEELKTVWTNGDLVSVFYRSDANQQWKYDGETGTRTADLTCVDAGEATAKTTRVVVVYPYNEDYYFNTETYNVQASLPATQTYLKDSYGLDGNIMISQSEYNNISLKNVCGWLKLQLTGNGEQIKSITLRGNNGEQVAGEMYINSADATATLASEAGDAGEDEGENETGSAGGNLVFEDAVLKEVTLNCLDSSSPTEKGVALGAEATAFYIALPPQTFAKGLTVEITAIDGSAMTQSTDNEVVIERNHIKPMTALTFKATKPANNEIWYTNGSTTAPTAPWRTDDAFGDATIQSNTYDAEKECWIITFDKDIKEIGDYAFHKCRSLTSVTIPDSVTTIEYSAFSYCTSLKEFKGKFAADNGRCLIMDNTIIAYANASGTTYTIPDSVTTIGEEAFYYCTSLTSVTIPDSVTMIGDWAFRECESLTSVTIPDSVTTIGGRTFSSCYSLKEFKGKFAADGGRCLIMDNTIIAYANASGTTYTIPDSVTTIGDDAFRDCNSLTSVTIPDSVTTIGVHAFYKCTSLTSVTIGNSVTTIGWGAFEDCSSLKTVYCKPTTPPVGGSNMFGSNASGRRIFVPASDDDSIIKAYKEHWSEYKDYIFEDEPKPANNEIWYTATAKVEPYYTNVFGAAYLSNVWDSETGKGVITFEGDVTETGYYAFYKCTSLTSVTIPNSVTTIGDWAFGYCESLTSVTIPDSVTTIGKYAFGYCYSLTSVTIPDSVKTIGYSTFSDCDSLTSVTIGDSVTTIGEQAFRYCESLTSVTIGNSVTTIGYLAFSDCDSLTSVTIPDSVKTIGNDAFAGCESLTSVTIPDSVTTIGDYAFSGCESLTSVTIPDSVTTIGDYAFSGCDRLKEFKGKFAADGGRCLIMDNTIIAYANASGTTYTIPESVTTIGNGAFNGCDSLTSVTIPDSVTTIGDWAFNSCDSLISVTIPDSVTTIGEYAFYKCGSLKYVYCKPTTPPTGGSSMFNYNAYGRKIYVPVGSGADYKEKQYWSTYKDYIYESSSL